MTIKVQIPTNLSARQRELITEYSKDEHASPTDAKCQKDSHHFINQAWSRLKDFLGSNEKDSKKKDSENKDDTKS